MKLSALRSLDQVIEEHRHNEKFLTEWDRATFARTVANRVIRYRADKGLSQRDLATIAGVVQPLIARLERGEHQPSLETLAKLSKAAGLEIHPEVACGSVDVMASVDVDC